MTRAKEVVGATGVLLLLWVGGSMNVDLDVWHSMALVREALREGRMPMQDPFAYTPTVEPVVHHEWGNGVILYAVGTHGGLAGLQALRLALVGTAVWFVIATARRRGAHAGLLILLGPLAAGMSWIGLTAVRPQLVTLTFLAVLLWSLERDRQGRRLPWWVWAPAFVVWANIHGGFVVGALFVAVHAAEQWVRGARVGHLLVLLALVAAGVAVNPYGLAYYPYLWEALRLERPLIIEWRPLWEAHPLGIAMVVLALLLAAYATLRVGVRRLPGWILLALAAYAAIRHERHVSILALVWAAYVPAALAATALGERMERTFARWGWPIAIALCLSALAGLVGGRGWELRVPATRADSSRPYPVGAEQYLREQHVRGNVMTSFSTGAYLTWKLHPRVKVSLDGRFEAAYAPSLLAEHLDFYHGAPDWQAIRDRYPTDLILVERGWEAERALRDEGRWSLVYEDDTFLLFARPGLSLPYQDRRGARFEGTFP